MPETENQAPSAARAPRQLRARGVAVHQELERPRGVFLLQDLAHHRRRPRGCGPPAAGRSRARRRHGRGTPRPARRAGEGRSGSRGRVSPMPTTLGRPPARSRSSARKVRVFLGFVRVGADRAPDVRHAPWPRRGRRRSCETWSQMLTIRPTPAARARAITSSRSSSNCGRVQVDVAVDQHRRQARAACAQLAQRRCRRRRRGRG